LCYRCDRELSQADAAGRRVVVVMRSGAQRRPTEEDLGGHPTIAAHVAQHTYLDEAAEDFGSRLAAAVGPRPPTGSQGVHEMSEDEESDQETTACLKLTRLVRVTSTEDEKVDQHGQSQHGQEEQIQHWRSPVELEERERENG